MLLKWLALMGVPILADGQHILLKKNAYLYKGNSFSMNYVISKPTDYASSNSNWPVLIYLHGTSASGLDVDKVLNYSTVEPLLQGKLPHLSSHFIFLAPQAPTYTWNSEKADRVMDLLGSLSKTERLDFTRIYLTGYSMGGQGVYNFVRAKPYTFAAAMPLAGNARDTSGMCSISHIPFWIAHGTDDNVISTSSGRAAFEKLRNCGTQAKWTEIPGGHDAAPELHQDTTITAWFLSHVRVSSTTTMVNGSTPKSKVHTGQGMGYHSALGSFILFINPGGLTRDVMGKKKILNNH